MSFKLNCWMPFICVIVTFPAIANGQDENKLKELPKETIQYELVNEPWVDMIQSYADKAGLDLTMHVDAPSGNFEFSGNRTMSYLDALDLLNSHLLTYNRILIRNDNALYLFDTVQGIPESMIQTVQPEDLDSRGKYEIVRCEFDISGLDKLNIRNEIEGLVDSAHQNRMVPVNSANLLIVQESVNKLRYIRDSVIKVAKANADDWKVEYIPLNHALPTDVIDAAVQMLGLSADTLATEDRSLSIKPHLSGERILASGKPEMIKKLGKLIAAVDQKFADNGNNQPDSYYQSYPVDGNVELIHEVLQSMMSGRSINLDFDAKTNRIHLRGRPSDHKDVVEVLEKTGKGSGNFAVVTLDTLDTDEAKEKIEEAFDLESTEEENGPTITELPPNRLVVRGNPADVNEIVQLLSQIDVSYQRAPGTRKVTRTIDMSDSEMDSTMQMLSERVGILDLNNEIQVVMPGETAWKYNRKNRSFEIHREQEILDDVRRREEELFGTPEQPPEVGAETSRNQQKPTEMKEKAAPAKDNSTTWMSTPGRVYTLQEANPNLPRNHAFPVTVASKNTQASYVSYVQEIQEDAAKTSDEILDEIESVPGAPIKLFVHRGGITIKTKDLDAGDKLEDLIMSQLTSTMTSENMKLFLLQHRDAIEAKTQLESYLGLSGGGAGGGMGDMMGGFLKNALPGGAGGMADALLGGGGGGSSAKPIRELAGDVAIVADVKHFSLLISAMSEDMALIEQLIDLIDQPAAFHNPNPTGRTRLIPIQYMDPEQLEGMIRANLSAVLKNQEAAGGNQRGNAEQAMQQQILKRMLGGGGGGGGAAEQETPKAAMSVDLRNRMLVVTGPQFVHDLVLDFVQKVDVQIPRKAMDSQFIQIGNLPASQLGDLLQFMDPNIEILPTEEATQTTQTNRQGSSNRTGMSGPTAGNMQDIFRSMQMQQGRGNRGGTRGGGQGFGGGRTGGRTGGGRGGRGGGGGRGR